MSGLAIRQPLGGLGLTPEIPATGRIRRHSAPGINVFQGDFQALTPDILGQVDGIHDRAAVFALLPDLQRVYGAHLVGLTGDAPLLLICLEHDSAAGPHFSVTGPEVAALYGGHYRITLLPSEPTEAFGLGRAAVNLVWHLARG